MDEHIHFIRSTVNINNKDLEYVLSHFKEMTIKKNRYVLKKHQFSTNYYFIKSGGVRIWFEKDAKPITAWLIFENSFFQKKVSSLLSIRKLFFIRL